MTADNLSFHPGTYALSVSADNSPSRAFDGLGHQIDFGVPALHLQAPGSQAPYGHYCDASRSSWSPVIPEGQTISVMIRIPRVLTHQNSLMVELSVDNNNVALESVLPGAATSVSWPANSALTTTFNVRGVQSGAFVITASAPGYQIAYVAGHVGR